MPDLGWPAPLVRATQATSCTGTIFQDDGKHPETNRRDDRPQHRSPHCEQNIGDSDKREDNGQRLQPRRYAVRQEVLVVHASATDLCVSG